MAKDPKMVVGTLRIRLVIRGARSLKDKRRVVRSVKDRVRHRFNASVAEVEALDSIQTAVLGVAVVANDGAHVRSVLAQIGNLARLARNAELAACDMEIL
jgi:hypothetical protein